MTRTAPSSEEKDAIEESGCAEGVLIEIDQTDVIGESPSEVCLVEEGGEELDLILWEDIKVEKNAQAFRLWTDMNPERSNS